MNKVVLLDRDGTIIIDPKDERVTEDDDIHLFEDSISALHKLAEAGYSAILITNQAGIGEGLIDEEEFYHLHAKVLVALSPSGLKILKTYLCPHRKDASCLCRKPKPTMVLDAIRDFGLDPAETYMVGEHTSDVVAGKAAGTKAILVLTATNTHDVAPEADFTANNLTEAVDYIITHS